MRLSHGLRAAKRDTAWDVSSARYDGGLVNYSYIKFSNPSGLFFKPDGTKLYISDSNPGGIHEYILSTEWDVSTAFFLQSFSVSPVTDLFFKPDGTKFYTTDNGSDSINEYNLSTAWDISTASFLQSFSVAAQEISPNGLYFKPDGTKVYIAGAEVSEINEYDLSVAWDISTASFLRLFSLSGQDLNPNSLSFREDGTKVYVLGFSADAIYEYNLSTAWNITTASFLRSFSVTREETFPRGLFFRSDGTEVYMTGNGDRRVTKYSLSTAWNISTASYTYPSNNFFKIPSPELQPNGLFFKEDGAKLYVVGATENKIFEYDLPSAWNITTASFLRSITITTQDQFANGLFFKPDGTKVYVVGSTGSNIYEYNLSTAWNISTASFLQSFSVAAQEGTPLGIFFKPDGTKAYIIGSVSANLHEYNLSTAWNVSTASFFQTLSLAGQNLGFYDVFFKADGLKLYTLAFGTVNEFNLSSAWNITTASFLRSFSTLKEIDSNDGIFFKPDGTKFYIAGERPTASIVSYDL